MNPGEHPRSGARARREHSAPGPRRLRKHSAPGPGTRRGWSSTGRSALTGTDHRTPVTDPDFAATRPFWHRTLPSESPEVYRAEHLAARLLADHGTDGLAGADLAALVRGAAEAAHDEGYERGVHDHDAASILEAVPAMAEGAGLLRFPGAARAAAQIFWAHSTTPDARDQWTRRAVALNQARDLFDADTALDGLRRELAEETGDPAAAAYLIAELASTPEGFALSDAARTVLDTFRRAVGSSVYDDALAALTGRRRPRPARRPHHRRRDRDHPGDGPPPPPRTPTRPALTPPGRTRPRAGAGTERRRRSDGAGVPTSPSGAAHHQ